MLRLYQNNVTWYNKQKFDMNPTNLIRNHHKNTAQKMLEQDREGSVNDLLDVAEDPLDLIHVHCKRTASYTSSSPLILSHALHRENPVIFLIYSEFLALFIWLSRTVHLAGPAIFLIQRFFKYSNDLNL
jgi:hypothetical protein